MVDFNETTAWTIEDMPTGQQEMITRWAEQRRLSVAEYVWEGFLRMAVAPPAELATCHETLREIYNRVPMAIIPQRHPELFEQMRDG